MHCNHCGSIKTITTHTSYGPKITCKDCGELIKDVDAYAGVMLFTHKTSSEIEIHANAASANVIRGASRRTIPAGKVRAIHIPGELAGRRDNNTFVKTERAANFDKAFKSPKQFVVDTLGKKLKALNLPQFCFKKVFGKTITEFSTIDVEKFTVACADIEWSTLNDLLAADIYKKISWKDNLLRLSLMLGWRASHGPPATTRKIVVIQTNNKYFDPNSPRAKLISAPSRLSDESIDPEARAKLGFTTGWRF